MVNQRKLLKQGFVPGSFHRQLTVVSSVGLLALALAISLVSSGLLAWRLEGLALTHLGELTGQFARESAFVFLAGSRDSARERAAQLAVFPGVRQAALLKPDAKIWVTSTDSGPWPGGFTTREWQAHPALAGEDVAYWFFAAPVRSGTTGSPLAVPGEAQLLGYVVVAWRKAPLAQLRSWLFGLNGSIALVLAVGIFMALHAFLHRLTEPLNSLAGVMQRMQAGETHVRASVAGPAEIRDIGQVFNRLMEQLEQHRIVLESAVTIRTQELREARDAALTATRYKSEFMAAMTHEMRTPLQSIIGYIQTSRKELRFLKEDVDPETFDNLTDYLRVALKASDELLLRINQVLELAALEAGKREVVLAPVDLAVVLDQIISIVKPLAESNRNRLDVIRQGLPRVEMDEDKLRQIVRNLLDNACKFTHDGAVRLQVRGTTDMLWIEVVDSGIGIPENQLQAIFEPFRQVDMSDTRRHGGTGLGLAITKNVCQLLGGTLTVESTLGRGSRFRVRVPLPVRSAVSDGSGAREPPDAVVM